MSGIGLAMKSILVTVLLALSASLYAAGEDRDILLIAGLEGNEEYGEIFDEAVDQWKKACQKGGADFSVIREKKDGKDPRNQVQEFFTKCDAPELWVVLIGHGTFDGKEAKFNLDGPDFTDRELADWTKKFEGELVVINMASASGSFVKTLSAPKRVVITATKSANEIFYTRFGIYFSEAVGGMKEADLDNDQQVSVLECFLYASDQVRQFFENEGRLATEHALMDDNGDGLGTRADWFEGATVTRVAAEGAEPDGERARQLVLVRNDFERNLNAKQRKQRDDLEREVRSLRRKKADLKESEYYDRLEVLLLKLARIYQQSESS